MSSYRTQESKKKAEDTELDLKICKKSFEDTGAKRDQLKSLMISRPA